MRNSFLFAVALFLAASAGAADRVALLIGNNTYAASPLRNAVNDARDLSAALKELGFKVIVKENATRKDMIDGLREFGAALDGANAALFFYAGHGMQFKERNYLIPIDAVMASEDDITLFSFEVNQVFDRMERAKTRHNFIILDACRDNPFASSFKLSSAGLAQMSSPTGTFIAYATSPGSVARDGFDRNGIYTKHILQNIKVPNQPVEIMFKRVREGVELETRRLQTPWDSSSLKGDFTFAESVRPGGNVAAASGPSADIQLQIEGEFWRSVRESNRADDIQAYLDKYPNGNFAPLARNKLNALVRPAEAASTLAAAQPARAGDAPTGTTMPRDPNPEPTMAARSAPGPAAAKPVPQVGEKPVEKPVVVAAAPAAAPPPAPAVAAPPVPAPAIVAPPAAPKRDEQPGREIAPGVREVVFADGSVYKGGMRGVVQHGKGEYISRAFQYQGEFRDGLKHGAGTYSWEGGDRYEGEFVEDRPSGRGKWRFSTGDTYEGEVKAGTIVGRGTYTTKGGDTFTGSFVDGRPHGVGVYRFASGDRYEGEMNAGVMNGRGRYITQAGDQIEAPFVAGRANGRGSYAFSNGDRYEGDIRDGALTGNGVYSYASGQRYEGELLAGEPHGRGTYWFVDGTRFEGQFAGLAKASGTVVRPDGSKAPAEMVAGAVKWLN
jgi:uncharacterized caspase-like protein